MDILAMTLPRLEVMARLAGDPRVARDPVALAELRETFRYLSSVCRALLPDLEEALADLPPGTAPDAPVEERVAFQMSLVKRTNRLHRAVEAYLLSRGEERRQAV